MKIHVSALTLALLVACPAQAIGFSWLSYVTPSQKVQNGAATTVRGAALLGGLGAFAFGSYYAGRIAYRNYTVAGKLAHDKAKEDSRKAFAKEITADINTMTMFDRKAIEAAHNAISGLDNRMTTVENKNREIDAMVQPLRAGHNYLMNINPAHYKTDMEVFTNYRIAVNEVMQQRAQGVKPGNQQ